MKRVSPVFLALAMLAVVFVGWQALRPAALPVEIVPVPAGRGSQSQVFTLTVVPPDLGPNSAAQVDAGGLNFTAPDLGLDIQLPAVPESLNIITGSVVTAPVPVPPGLRPNSADLVDAGGLNFTAPDLRLDIQLPAVPESLNIITGSVVTAPVPVPDLGLNAAGNLAGGGLKSIWPE
jgi:hypothetical protein